MVRSIKNKHVFLIQSKTKQKAVLTYPLSHLLDFHYMVKYIPLGPL